MFMSNYENFFQKILLFEVYSIVSTNLYFICNIIMLIWSLPELPLYILRNEETKRTCTEIFWRRHCKRCREVTKVEHVPSTFILTYRTNTAHLRGGPLSQATLAQWGLVIWQHHWSPVPCQSFVITEPCSIFWVPRGSCQCDGWKITQGSIYLSWQEWHSLLGELRGY